MNAALLALLPSLALAAPPPTTRNVAVLLVPVDRAAESSTLVLEGYMNDALEEYASNKVKKSEELFGLPPDDEAEASLKRAELGFRESRASFDEKEWDDAERKLRATLKEYQKAAPALKDTKNLCEATAMYASTMLKRGDAEEAKLLMLDLLALDPAFDLSPKKFDKDLIALRSQVATSRYAQLRGNATVKSKPAGARVILNGDAKGFTPTTLQTLPIGKHLIRVELPGHKIYGQIIEVTPEDVEVEAVLSATATYKTFEEGQKKLAAEVNKEKAGPPMTNLAKSLGIDRGVVGTVKALGDAGKTEVNLGIFDMKSGKRLASKKLIFQGDEFGQLKEEAGRAVTQLMNLADGGGAEKAVKSSDPLDGKGGTEDWTQGDRGGRQASEEKKKKNGDPLDGVSGTDEW